MFELIRVHLEKDSVFGKKNKNQTQHISPNTSYQLSSTVVEG